MEIVALRIRSVVQQIETKIALANCLLHCKCKINWLLNMIGINEMSNWKQFDLILRWTFGISHETAVFWLFSGSVLSRAAAASASAVLPNWKLIKINCQRDWIDQKEKWEAGGAERMQSMQSFTLRLATYHGLDVHDVDGPWPDNGGQLINCRHVEWRKSHGHKLIRKARKWGKQIWALAQYFIFMFLSWFAIRVANNEMKCVPGYIKILK